MKQILFVGQYDKTDLLFYLAKVLSQSKKVLIADYSGGRYEFAFPKIEMDSDLQEYDGFDVRENLKDYDSLQALLQESSYDIVLIDQERSETLKKWPAADHYYLVSSYDNPTMMQNVRLIHSFFEDKPVAELFTFRKILYEVHDTNNETFINDLMEKYPIHWEESLTYYPDERDLTLKIKNQFSNSVRMKGLSRPYKDVIKTIVSDILEISLKETITMMKQIERRN
ncbi:hypothetical protein [Paenibacillus campinasensis]|uniref:AAA family ATPase n=1 Tax=Paenibacillus campinasensis TaxID=66347 RepID=A0A268EDZ6_9BACL|nr:hypothetical protein [Paenibacillus campinasensis]PAD71343.1 hypothetical protein CHH67_24675 [Paenibacillus campinasensis]